jgi:hypothetical protein
VGTPGTIESATHLVDGWPAFDSNIYGQFEDNDFVKLFDDAHGAWELPHWWRVSNDDSIAARALIEKREAAHSLWGLKTPQLCYTLGYLLEYFEDPVVIVTHRDFDDMVDSLQKRDRMPRAVCEQIQAQYFLLCQSAAELIAQQGVPILDLEFEEVLRYPYGTVDAIMKFVGMPPLDPHRQRAIISIHARQS